MPASAPGGLPLPSLLGYSLIILLRFQSQSTKNSQIPLGWTWLSFDNLGWTWVPFDILSILLFSEVILSLNISYVLCAQMIVEALFTLSSFYFQDVHLWLPWVIFNDLLIHCKLTCSLIFQSFHCFAVFHHNLRSFNICFNLQRCGNTERVTAIITTTALTVLLLPLPMSFIGHFLCNSSYTKDLTLPISVNIKNNPRSIGSAFSEETEV